MTGSSRAARGGAYKTGGYERERKALLAGNPPCIHCQRRTATEADHVPPLSQHEHVPGTGCCVLAPSCAPCARRQGGVIGATGVAPRVTSKPVYEPPSLEQGSFDVPWLLDLLDVPDDATWPRLMSAPHPDAVGSYGYLVEVSSLAFRGVPLRWWQKLYARRLLEHDADGRLVWGIAVLTLARQLGKSWLLGDLCWWRLHARGLFGCEQTVLSTAKEVAVIREVQRPFLARAKRDSDVYHPRSVNGQESIEIVAAGDRWLLRSKEGVYGITASFATLDESWDIPASVLDDGVEPTTVEAVDSQILVISTAHRKATALMIGRRARALANLDTGEGPLIVEWSAPPGSELDDRDAWRMASPLWTPGREKLMSQRLEGALAGESDDVDEPDPIWSFRTQWRNEWPAKRLALTKGDALVEFDEWEALRGDVADNRERLFVAIEDHGGFGAAIAAVAVQADGRYGIDGWTVSNWAAAIEHLRRLLARHDSVTMYAGATLLQRMPPGMRASAGTATLSRSTLPLMRELVRAGAIVHDSLELDEQLETFRVTDAIGGLAPVAGSRSDLVRAASWALGAAYRPKRTPSIH